MRFGIFTPSHDLRHLGQCLRSVVRASEGLAERPLWVVLLNGAAKPNNLPPVFGDLLDKDVPVDFELAQAKAPAGNVGALKAEACALALERGAAHLLELDHDDELVPGIFQALRRAFEAGAGFVATETATMSRYRPDYGWKSQSEVVDGHRLWVNQTPEICSRSLATITTAPNHARAWSAAAYKAAGGYDATLALADDLDLMCKTYRAGVEMALVHEPLYVQHEHKQQTQLTRNREVQEAQAAVGARHLYGLAREEARRRSLRCLDLGGAHSCPDGFEAVDLPGTGAAIEVDIRQGLPFPDNSIGVLRAHDFLEHLPAESVIHVMNECYRVLAPGGWLLTSTPSTDGRGAFQDPTHVSFWNSNSFWYYTRAEQAQYVPAIRCRFQAVRLVNHYPSDWHKAHEIVYCDAALWALKGQPEIGLVQI